MAEDRTKRSLLPRIASYSATDGASASAYNSETSGAGPVVNGSGSSWAPKVKSSGDGANNPGWAEWEATHCSPGTHVKERANG